MFRYLDAAEIPPRIRICSGVSPGGQSPMILSIIPPKIHSEIPFKVAPRVSPKIFKEYLQALFQHSGGMHFKNPRRNTGIPKETSVMIPVLLLGENFEEIT